MLLPSACVESTVLSPPSQISRPRACGRSSSSGLRTHENVLGFLPGEYYAPTKWQPYTFGDQCFAIREVENKKPHDDHDITNFELDDVGTGPRHMQSVA
jgi:hypothetical protein